MAIEKGSIERAPLRWPQLRMPAWLATALMVALVLVAGGVGGLIMAELTRGGPLQVQFPGTMTVTVPTTADSVTVSGAGRVVAAPDTVYVDLGAWATRGTLPDALAAMTDDANKLTAALKTAGVAEADMQTTGLGAWTNTDNMGNVMGYQASTSLRIRVRDVGKTTAILNAAAGAIGNDIRFNGLQYTRTDIATQAAQARQLALTAAHDRADAIAKASNRQLGKIVAVQEDYVTYVPAGGYPGGYGGGGGGGGYIPQIQTGQGEVVVQLTVTYSLT